MVLLLEKIVSPLSATPEPLATIMHRCLAIVNIFIPLFVMFGCGRKAFPDERFSFSAKYRDLVSSYHPGDTLYFMNEASDTLRIKITGVDSTISNRKGGFINPRPHKDISVYYDVLSNIRKSATDTFLILINIYPDSLEQSAYFSLMNFRGNIEGEQDSLIADFRPVEGKSYSNCFGVKNVATDLGEKDDDIEYVYIQQSAGIIAFKTYHGDWWIKQ